MTEELHKVARRSNRILTSAVVAGSFLLMFLTGAVIFLSVFLFQNKHELQQQVAFNTQDRIKISYLVTRQDSEQALIRRALCDNEYTVATVNVPSASTKVLVQFVESARKAFTVLQCPGRLGPPPKSLVKAGDANNVPIRY